MVHCLATMEKVSQGGPRIRRVRNIRRGYPIQKTTEVPVLSENWAVQEIHGKGAESGHACGATVSAMRRPRACVAPPELDQRAPRR